MSRDILERLRRLDHDDALKRHRDKFLMPENTTYLDGNSLGCLSHSARQNADRAIAHEWGKSLIGGWLEGWFDLPVNVGDRIGRLIGAAPGQTIASDSTSINLYKTLSAALSLRPTRNVILTDKGNFPTDVYIIESIARQLGCKTRIVASNALGDHIDDEVAVIAVSHIDYKTSAIYDMEALTAAAHSKGALALWDLAHTAGAVPCELDRWNVDFAVGCGYKYLNGGPGAPAFLYAAKRHQQTSEQPLQGWFGHRAPFDFADSYLPASDIRRFQCGTPSVIGLAALNGALDAFDDVEIGQLFNKSQAMVREFILLFDEYLAPFGFELTSERFLKKCGSHVSLSHDNAYQIMRALNDRRVIGDFRAPNVLRFGFSPLYNRFEEIGYLVLNICEIMNNSSWKNEKYKEKLYVT